MSTKDRQKPNLDHRSRSVPNQQSQNFSLKFPYEEKALLTSNFLTKIPSKATEPTPSSKQISSAPFNFTKGKFDPEESGLMSFVDRKRQEEANFKDFCSNYLASIRAEFPQLKNFCDAEVLSISRDTILNDPRYAPEEVEPVKFSDTVLSAKKILQKLKNAYASVEPVEKVPETEKQRLPEVPSSSNLLHPKFVAWIKQFDETTPEALLQKANQNSAAAFAELEELHKILFPHQPFEATKAPKVQKDENAEELAQHIKELKIKIKEQKQIVEILKCDEKEKNCKIQMPWENVPKIDTYPYFLNMLRGGSGRGRPLVVVPPIQVDNLDEQNEEEFAELQELAELGNLLQMMIRNADRDLLMLGMERHDDFVNALPPGRAIRHFFDRWTFPDHIYERLTGFTPAEATILLRDIGQYLERATMRSGALTSNQALMIVLNLFRTGDSFTDVGLTFGVSKQTVSRLIRQVCPAVIQHLSHYIDTVGTEGNWRRHSQMFYERHGLPYIVGAIDGTLVLKRNIKNLRMFYGRTKIPSINMVAMVDSARMIRFLSCRMPGSAHDIRVYRTTALADQVQRGWRPCRDAAVLADKGYIGIREFLIPSQKRILPHERAFYQSTKNARLIVEHTFADLKNMFQILHYGIDLRDDEDVVSVIATCVILYNYRKVLRGENDTAETDASFPPLPPLSPRCPTFASRYIDLFNRMNANN